MCLQTATKRKPEQKQMIDLIDVHNKKQSKEEKKDVFKLKMKQHNNRKHHHQHVALLAVVDDSVYISLSFMITCMYALNV